jgi:hypothetical protein
MMTFPILFLAASVALTSAQGESKTQKEESPGDTVKTWINAAAKRDWKTVEQLASKTTPKRTLKLLKEQGFLNYQGTAKIIHEEISGDRAVVVYRLENRDAVFTPEVQFDIIVLVREDKQWKVDTRGGGVLKPGKQPNR